MDKLVYHYNKKKLPGKTHGTFLYYYPSDPKDAPNLYISRCKECGVSSEVVSIWAGHSLSGTITSTVYTHYSDEFQLKEAEKVIY